ncbi:MAG: SynChlorMet cassette radical SAM/SPASM protein ScmE [Methanotrichaceae archaeon]|nr:SynChlorMet cassette radical SAM/SPASM protein ScmE [Methanotrichaceae archaeon]
MIRSSQTIMRTPRNVHIDITSRCNLRCKYCYYFDNEDVSYADLPAEDWLRFFDELALCAVMNVCLAGGEPFMREDLPTLLKGIINRKMRFSILSNGTLIDDEIARFIAGTDRCDYVQISVDGSHPETHDACRGPGSFDGAIRGICMLRKYNIPIAVRVTINRNNCQDLENIAHLLLEELKLSRFSTNSAGALGTCNLSTSDILLEPQERQIAMETLLLLIKKYPRRILAQAGPLAEARTWRLMDEARQKESAPFPNGGRLTACGCVYNTISVRSDGVITPCNLLPHMDLGRINRDSLQNVWQNSPSLNRMRQRSSIPLTDFEFCADCSYIPYCTGNCPAMAFSLTGQVDHPSPDACLQRYLLHGGRLPSDQE